MATHKIAADWTTIDPSTLPSEAQLLFNESKAVYRQYKDAKQAFEDAMQAGVPEGMRMIFGYNFGKLSAAIVPDDRKLVKAKASTQSLADFLASQGAAGRRV